MNKNIFIMVAVLVVLLSVGGFWMLTKQSNQTNQAQSVPITQPPIEKIVKIQPSTVLPSLPPLAEKIKSLDEGNIIVTGEKGDMHLPKNPDIVTVLKRTGTGSLIPATFADLKVGQKTTLNILIPGKKAELIIEQ